MAQNVNDNFYVKGNILLDAKKGVWDSIDQFKQFVAPDEWAEGLDIYVRNAGKIDHYRFEGGAEEVHLVLKASVNIVLSVATIVLRNEIPASHRLWGVPVSVYNDGANTGQYYMKFGKVNEDLADNGNWEKFEGGGGAGGHILQDAAGNDLAAREKLRGENGIEFQNKAGEEFTSAVLGALIKLGVADQAGNVRTIQAVGSEADIDIAVEPQGNGVVKSTKWAGEGERVITVDETGRQQVSTSFVPLLINVADNDSQNRNLVTDEWTSTRFYRDGVPGQTGDSGAWRYMCISDNVWVKSPLGQDMVEVFIKDSSVIGSLTDPLKWDVNNNYIETDSVILTKLLHEGPFYAGEDYFYINTPLRSISKAGRIQL